MYIPTPDLIRTQGLELGVSPVWISPSGARPEAGKKTAKRTQNFRTSQPHVVTFNLFGFQEK
jgi:hypothetical protein